MSIYYCLYLTFATVLQMRLSTVVRRIRRDQRGNIAMLAAVALPMLLTGVGMSVDVSRWSMVKQRLRHTVDAAAFAGAADFVGSNNMQGAANTAADLAELNGAAGSASRTWNATNNVLSDGLVTVQVMKGVKNSSSTAFQVTIKQSVPVTFPKIMVSASSVDVSATGWAETQTNMQPCILALGAAGAGITAIGNASATLTGCSARSNASIATVGNASISASAFYANGLITGSETGGTAYPNDGVIADPYASYSPVQTALKRLIPGYGAPFNSKPHASDSLSSGEWSSWDMKGNVTLDPGIYYVNGDISIDAQGSLSGTGVTIVTSGSLKMTGGASLTLSAALSADAPTGAVPGVVFAGNSLLPSSFSGNTNPSLTGVVYYPNGALDFGGTSQSGTSGCLEVIAASVGLKGNSSMAANCQNKYGALPFKSDNSASAALVR